VEPNVMLGRDRDEPVSALFTDKGYAVNFEALAESFVQQTRKLNTAADIQFGSPVTSIVKTETGYDVTLQNQKVLSTALVVVDADSYSLLFAKQLGYGTQYSLIPIAGTFYFSEKLLNGKVYTVQEPKLPFAAVHGDPDILVSGKTRWGPTARFYPVLESRNFKTSVDYLRSSGLSRGRTWTSFFKILLDPVRFTYLLENMLYELPWIGDRMFLKNVRKIIPSIKISDVEKAVGFGGMRLQRVDTDSGELQLGEGKIIGDNIIFNMTPSPGASVCLYNAMRDIDQIMLFSKGTFTFDKQRMQQDLITELPVEMPAVQSSYAS
jgi:malate dehydrogenase (quinone)